MVGGVENTALLFILTSYVFQTNSTALHQSGEKKICMTSNNGQYKYKRDHTFLKLVIAEVYGRELAAHFVFLVFSKCLGRMKYEVQEDLQNTFFPLDLQ